jgi:C_GCAxxG_C_C family probable redox protein
VSSRKNYRIFSFACATIFLSFYRQENHMDKIERSASDFSKGYSCAQAVIRAFSEDLGLDLDLATRAAAAYGGGIARSGRLCGAVTGALMAIGLCYGSADPEDRGAKESTYTLARRFMQQFETKHGSLDCPVLLGVSIGTPEGMQMARSQGLFATRCPVYVKDAVEMVLQLTEK